MSARLKLIMVEKRATAVAGAYNAGDATDRDVRSMVGLLSMELRNATYLDKFTCAYRLADGQEGEVSCELGRFKPLRFLSRRGKRVYLIDAEQAGLPMATIEDCLDFIADARIIIDALVPEGEESIV